MTTFYVPPGEFEVWGFRLVLDNWDRIDPSMHWVEDLQVMDHTMHKIGEVIGLKEDSPTWALVFTDKNCAAWFDTDQRRSESGGYGTETHYAGPWGWVGDPELFVPRYYNGKEERYELRRAWG